MNIPIALLSAIETALNAWLRLDGESLKKCETLEGKIIRLHITGLDVNLYFFPALSGIQVMSNYPGDSVDSAENDEQSENSGTEKKHKTQYTGEVDATIHGSPMALIRLSTSQDAGASLLDSNVEIDGDMRVAEQFSAILKEVDIDWEELLSKLVGDIIAHQAGQVVKGGSDWLTHSIEAMKLNTSEYLSEESKATPASAELEYYMDQVDDLRMDSDRLTARVKLIQEQLSQTSNGQDNSTDQE